MTDERISIDDDLMADAQAAYAEAAARADEAEAGEADEPAGGDAAPGGEKAELRAETTEGDDDKLGDGRERDENGRFKAKKSDDDEKGEDRELEKEVAAKEKAADPDKAEGQEQESAENAAPAAGPPPSWSVKAKAAWDDLPAHVRADIAKRETEVNDGFKKLRDFKDLEPWVEKARASNTTISQAMTHYTGMEEMLRSDPGAGMARIAQNIGLSQPQAAQLFGQLAQRYGAAPGQQHAEADPLQDMLNPFMAPLQQKIDALEKQLSSRVEADQNASRQSLERAIEDFASDPSNRYFADLEETINRLFESGMVRRTGDHAKDLRTAYDTAARMHPEVSEALIEQRGRAQQEAQRKKEKEAADKARAASRSITGSGGPGVTVKDRKPVANGFDDIEADVRAAWNLHAQA